MREVSPGRSALLVSILFAAGLLLRWYFVRWHSFVAGDSTLYLDIAQSWVDAHTYGLSTNTVPRPTLIRLPGYPMVLAALQLLAPGVSARANGTGVFQLVMWLQVVTDLCACGLLASLAARRFGQRAGMAALALSCLCPFLANYTAVPLTESFVLFGVVMAYWAADTWWRTQSTATLVLAAAALSSSILLRPDQGLLSAAVLPLFALPAARHGSMRWRPALVCGMLVAMPLVPWTIRNARTFHVFQPLAPKSATDPGEAYAQGFPRWYRTFAIDFSTTEDAYWDYPETPVDANDLPARAFDSPAQRRTTETLLRRAALARKLQPDIEAGFNTLARERIHAHPWRSRIGLPLARLANMLLHPRTEMLPVDERWWRYSLHPAQTIFAAAYGLLNLAYIVGALLGLPRAWRCAPALSASMCLYIALRCALLLTLDNAEQRYTLEFLPLAIFFAAAWFTPRPPKVAA